jgi:hypothetical protein
MSPSALIPHLGMALEKAFCTFRMYLLLRVKGMECNGMGANELID